MKQYIRYIADRRLIQLGLDPLYHVERNPLPWLDDMLNAVEHTNFFENRATEYSRASTIGTLGGGVRLGIGRGRAPSPGSLRSPPSPASGRGKVQPLGSLASPSPACGRGLG